ncbi:pentapeptide repeat-containing protein [uncultured Methanocorpusculum sp.]|nr:pentapeptide repeat-containing protein [uncultured Methanocorpusculum sp.]
MSDNEDLFQRLSFDHLITCAKNGRILEWNEDFREYYKAEWEKLNPERVYEEKSKLEDYSYFDGFRGPIFERKNFTDSIQSGAKFNSALLIGANLTGSSLNGAYFIDANLQGANFTSSSLNGAYFIDANLQGANFTCSSLDDANFSDAHLEGANFTWSSKYNANFTKTHLHGANFMGARLKGAIFKYSHLEGANFTGTRLWDATFMYAQLKDAKFNNSHLEGTDFAGSYLEGVDFSGTHLLDVYYGEAQLKDANFNNSHLEGADFSNANLQGAQFLTSNLKGTNFYLTRLEGAKFKYTIVRGTQFIEVIIDDKTDFTGTYLAEILTQPKLRKHLERNIRKLNITNKNVFVAMKFDNPELDSALENAIKPACLECGGLKACTIKEKAGDGWIPQRIKEEIQDARFVISDLTYTNPGVYYETGYADGLEIPVIQTCKRSWCNEDHVPLHFDISQRNTIFWKDNDDLKQQLIMKIKELQETGK